MTWLNWLIGKKSAASQQQTHSEMLMSRQLDSVQPHYPGKSGGSAQPAVAASAQRLEQRRTERNAKRELLFQVVRESMVRVGVLSSAFKFKVLSLDQRGRSFLVMIELASEFSGEVEKLAEIENMIAQTAKHRFEIVVQAVYWRYFGAAQNSATNTAAPLLGALQAPISRPAPLFAMDAHANTPVARPPVAATDPRAPAAATEPRAPTRADPYSVTSAIPIIGVTANQVTASRASTQPAAQQATEDLGDDEVAAFRRALAVGATQGAMAASPARSSIPAVPAATRITPTTPVAKSTEPSNLEKARSKLLLTGYEDTEMADDDPMPALSGTQYGELH